MPSSSLHARHVSFAVLISRRRYCALPVVKEVSSMLRVMRVIVPPREDTRRVTTG